ncbi:ATP-binding protein [Streptomyces lunaelactis]|uniref:ATP-binding protein n=1 Tax=Streptomyces lunaelactis TaxID=1535768 RepID=UPI0020C79FA2|nr:ATP-binding protein [Streptomyces lunaelactis]
MNHVTDSPPAGISDSYRMGFTVGAHSARHLRRILRTFLTRWDMAGLTDDAELALTELVANVVQHVPGRHCTLLILRRPDGLRVEVADEHPGSPRPVRPECRGDELDEGGRGLLLVEAVTDRWGTVPLPGGKTVWFECDA